MLPEMYNDKHEDELNMTIEDMASKWEKRCIDRNQFEDLSTDAGDSGLASFDEEEQSDFSDVGDSPKGDDVGTIIPAVPGPHYGSIRKLKSILCTPKGGIRTSLKKFSKRRTVTIGSGSITEYGIPIEESTWVKPKIGHRLPKVEMLVDTMEVREVPGGSYEHTENIKLLTPKREEEKAHIRAIALQESLAIDDIDESWLAAAPSGFRRRMVRAITPDPHVSAIAKSMKAARKWIVDSGCPLDLIGSDELTENERKFIFKIIKDVRLCTANGATSCTKGVAFDHTSLQDRIQAHILDSTPNVVSMGKRCMKLGYDFIWKAGEKPYLVDPGGKKVILDVIHDVPYLPDGIESVCDPRDLDSFDISAVPGPVSTASESEGTVGAVQDGAPGDGQEDSALQEEGGEEGEDDEAIDPADERRDLKAEAKSKEHLLTHYPFNKWCPACVRSRSIDTRHKNLGGVQRYEHLKRFGDSVTADTIVARSRVSKGINGEKDGIVMYDIATDTLECYPVKSRNYDDTYNAFRAFAGPKRRIDRLHTDDAPEFKAVAKI